MTVFSRVVKAVIILWLDMTGVQPTLRGLASENVVTEICHLPLCDNSGSDADEPDEDGELVIADDTEDAADDPPEDATEEAAEEPPEVGTEDATENAAIGPPEVCTEDVTEYDETCDLGGPVVEWGEMSGLTSPPTDVVLDGEVDLSLTLSPSRRARNKRGRGLTHGVARNAREYKLQRNLTSSKHLRRERSAFGGKGRRKSSAGRTRGSPATKRSARSSTSRKKKAKK